MTQVTCTNCDREVKNCQCGGETETYENDAPACPHCGYKYLSGDPDWRWYNDGEYEEKCADCGKIYQFETYISHSYTATKLLASE